MHHWPAWGRDRVLELLGMARDGYRFINDETLRLANHGLTPSEIAEQVEFPPDARPPLGDARLLRHAQPQRQGDLRQLPRLVRRQPGQPPHATRPRRPPSATSSSWAAPTRRWTRRAARSSCGDYRWVAEVVNHVVFADPDNQDARDLQADALEQLGYQAESGPWRNFYLTAAQELRDGVRQLPTPNTASPDTVRAMSTELFLDYLAHAAQRRQGRRSRASRSALTMPDIGGVLDADGAQRRAQPPARAPRRRRDATRHDRPRATSTRSSSASRRSPDQIAAGHATRSKATSRRCTTSSHCSTTSSSGSTS